MFVNSIVAAGALLSVAAAVPMHQHQNKRDVVWVTETQEDVVTVPVTVTQWVEPGFTPPANSHYGHHHRPQVTSHIQSTVTIQPSPPAASSPESTYVPPPPSSYEAPSSTSVYVPPPAPTTSSVYVAPTTSAAPAPPPPAPSSWSAPSPAPSPAPSQPSSGGSSNVGGAAGSHTGDITYWTPGLGSCGKTNSESEMVVALSTNIMTPLNGANPNYNPLCGKTINISYGGVTQSATVVDTCGGCSTDSIDLSPTLFQKFASLSAGRVSGVSWSLS